MMEEANNLEKKAFVNYGITEDLKKPISVRITEEDREWLTSAKRTIRQAKTSTALKQLAKIGYELVIQDKKIKDILDTVLGNVRRNDRTGITESEYEI